MLADTEQLAALIVDKNRILLELRDLGRHQSKLIGSGEITELLRMLAEKQRLIDRLQQIERGLDAFRHQDPDARVWRSTKVRQQCAEVVEQSQRLLDEILEQERQNETHLMRKRDDAAVKLQLLQAAQQARQAYTENEQTIARAFDLSS